MPDPAPTTVAIVTLGCGRNEVDSANAAGLLAASWDEGFGLPLIEAAYHGVPILARDIPVFREVAGGHGSFFEASTPTQLAFALRAWADGAFQPPSEGLPCLTWQQSAANLLRAIGKG